MNSSSVATSMTQTAVNLNSVAAATEEMTATIAEGNCRVSNNKGKNCFNGRFIRTGTMRLPGMDTPKKETDNAI
ncbi:MAG: hypothetical protein HQM08_30870 [Candidatus Riflebacteria bacterium]|nr:hypothetical protein [Candidatus Riflebacteria bacterium]